jgi:hypothetical protein
MAFQISVDKLWAETLLLFHAFLIFTGIQSRYSSVFLGFTQITVLLFENFELHFLGV